MAAFFESQFKGHKGDLVNQRMIFSNISYRCTIAYNRTNILLHTLSGTSMALKWVAMTKKKNENEKQF